MNDFKKIAGASATFAAIYTLCMYKNSASITFPILMAAGIWFLYKLQDERRMFDNFMSGFYTVGIMAIAVSVFMTADWKLIFMNKLVVWVLYLGLAVEIYLDDLVWTDFMYIKKIFFMPIQSFFTGFEVFTDYSIHKEQSQDEEIPKKSHISENAWKVIKGLLIVIPLMFVILPLMMSADIVFEKLVEKIFVEDIFEFILVDWNIVTVGLTFGAAFLTIYGFVKIFNKDKNQVVISKYSDDYITGITVTGVVAFVYVVFSIVQIRGILVSNINLPEGYTYAQYAREGFFQLFALAVINMLIVMICASKYKYNKILNTILFVLCACTYVIIFSSAYKMILYIDVYNLTFLRLMVLWSLIVLTVVMVAVIMYVHKNDFSLLRCIVVITTFFYIIIAFGRPDYMVAKYNLDWSNNKEVDSYYLRYGLSCDAMPILIEHYEKFTNNYFDYMKEECTEESIRKFNLSKAIAANLITQKQK